jgi:hypothetical protein
LAIKIEDSSADVEDTKNFYENFASVLEQIAPQSMFRMYEIPLFYNAHPNRD